ncbi:MAG TPA: ABC transporter substrate-binding protein, partial [Longimicrobiaceae bacterium]|nr:ABC transporter substrate-binding protein [Longimicrobiaceae bacterium]
MKRLLPSCALLLLLTACGGGEHGKQPAQQAAPGGHYDTFSGGPPGGVLVFLSEREPDELNPLTYDSNPAYQAVHLIFRALARRDSTLSHYAPDLARSWELRPDSTLVLHLRHDVHWHDGAPVTSADVVYTIEMQRDKATASPRQNDVAAVRKVSAPDSFTVLVKLDNMGVYTVNSLLEVVPVPKHLLQDVPAAMMRRTPFDTHPVGDGFYKFERWDRAQQLVLDVDAQKPDGRAALDRVIFRFVPDLNAAMTELLAGQGDLMQKVPPDQRQRIVASPDVKLYTAPRVRPAWIAWNTRRPPLNDVRVRRALLMGIDRPRLAKGLFGDVGEPALSPIPDALSEHDPNVRPIPYDPAGAKQLLARAGWTDSDGDGILDRNGQPLRIQIDFISGNQTYQDVLVAIQAMLKQIGVDIVPRAYESTAWVDRLRNRQFEGSMWGWGW